MNYCGQSNGPRARIFWTWNLHTKKNKILPRSKEHIRAHITFSQVCISNFHVQFKKEMRRGLPKLKCGILSVDLPQFKQS